MTRDAWVILLTNRAQLGAGIKLLSKHRTQAKSGAMLIETKHLTDAEVIIGTEAEAQEIGNRACFGTRWRPTACAYHEVAKDIDP